MRTPEEIDGLLIDLIRSALKQQLKDVDLLKYVWCFEWVLKGLRKGYETCHERVNKINVHGYPLGPVRHY